MKKYKKCINRYTHYIGRRTITTIIQNQNEVTNEPLSNHNPNLSNNNRDQNDSTKIREPIILKIKTNVFPSKR